MARLSIFAMVVIIVGLTSASVHAADGTLQYLAKHKSDVVFYTGCSLSSHDKAVLLLASGDSSAWYAIIQDKKLSIYFGNLLIAGGEWKAQNFANGLKEQKRNSRIALWLARRPFHALLGGDFHRVYDDEISSSCGL